MATTAEVPSLKAESIYERQSPTVEAFRRLFRHRSGQLGIILLGTMLFVAIFAKVIAPYSPIDQRENVQRRSPPCIHILGCPASQPQAIMGIDSNFRDFFSRIIYGARLSLE